MPVDQILTGDTFATVGGGMAFVTVAVFVIRKAATDGGKALTPIQTLIAQAVFTLAWASAAVALFMTGPISTRISAVVVMAVVVMAMQTGAYEWFKAFKASNGPQFQTLNTAVESATDRWTAAEAQVADGGTHEAVLRAWDDTPGLVQLRDAPTKPLPIVADEPSANRGGLSRPAGNLPPMPEAIL